MTVVTDDGFQNFCTAQATALRRIARATRGEHDLSDVIGAAWLLARELAAKTRTPVLFLDGSYQKFLISRLYQRLVRYTDKKIRTSLRLEHSATPDDDSPLSERLSDSDGDHALGILIREEEQRDARTEADVPDTAIKAYVRLLARFHSMHAVARHLMISVSYSYRCRANALKKAHVQPPVPTRMMEAEFLPGPWRKRRFQRVPRQFAFDFEDELPFNAG